MEVTYRLEDEDYRALARFLMYDTPRGRLTLRRHLGLAVILSVGAAGAIYAVKRDAVLGVLFGAFCFVLMYMVRERTARAQAGKIYRTIRPSDERRMSEPGTLSLTPEGIEAQYGKGAGKLPWRGVSQVGRDSSHVFFILGRVNALVVPQREFESPEKFEEFYQEACRLHSQAWM